MSRYINLLGGLWVAWGLFQAMISVLIFGLFGSMGSLLAFLGLADGDGELVMAGGFYACCGTSVAVFSVVMWIPCLIVAMGIFRRSSWAPIAAIILGALSLSSQPFGLFVGIFTLVVMLDSSVRAEFAGTGTM